MKRVSLIYTASLVGCIYLGYLIGGSNEVQVDKQEPPVNSFHNRNLIKEIATQNKVIIKHQEKMEKIVEYLFKYELGTPVPKFEEEGNRDEN